jgi:hypothetical protein
MGLEPIELEAEEKQPDKSEVRWLARHPAHEAPLAVERSYA